MEYRRHMKACIKACIILTVFSFIIMCLLTVMAKDNPNSILLAIYCGIIQVITVVILVSAHKRI